MPVPVRERGHQGKAIFEFPGLAKWQLIFRDCISPTSDSFPTPNVMDPSSSTATNRPRPYRSHRHPACRVCRQRKIRCHIDTVGEPCRFCKEKQLQCEVSSVKSISQLSRRRRTTSGISQGNGRHSSQTANGDAFLSPQESSTMMANQTMAEDLDVLEQYLSSRLGIPNAPSQAYTRVPHNSGESVVYLKLPRRRPRLQNVSQVPGRAQREIMQQVLHSCEQELIDL